MRPWRERCRGLCLLYVRYSTLTFYYDNQRSSHDGTTYDLNTGSHDAGWDRDGTKSYVTKVVFDPSFAGARPTSTYGWFYDMRNLQSIEGMSYLNTSEVTNMGWMFYFCLNLKSLDVSQFNTAKVTTMTCMFEACNYITTFDLSNWTTSNVTEMGSMFSQCFDLQTIYVGDGWSTAAVEYGTSMFYNCTSLVGGQGTTYDANHEDKTYAHIDGGPDNPGYFTKGSEAYTCYTEDNTTLTFYFDRLRSTREGRICNLNSTSASPPWWSNGTKDYVTKVVFDPSFAGARPTITYGWFKDMRRLETIEGMRYLNTSEVTNMASMFNTCTKITSLDLSNLNTASVTDMGNMFYECSNLQTIYVGDGWNTDAVTFSKTMFYHCQKLVGGQGTTYNGNYSDKTYARIDGGPDAPGYFTAPPTGITTGIENGQRESVKDQSEEWFTIDGQKLSGKPTKKGVYIHNSRAVVL